MRSCIHPFSSSRVLFFCLFLISMRGKSERRKKKRCCCFDCCACWNGRQRGYFLKKERLPLFCVCVLLLLLFCEALPAVSRLFFFFLLSPSLAKTLYTHTVEFPRLCHCFFVVVVVFCIYIYICRRIYHSLLVVAVVNDMCVCHSYTCCCCCCCSFLRLRSCPLLSTVQA